MEGELLAETSLAVEPFRDVTRLICQRTKPSLEQGRQGRALLCFSKVENFHQFLPSQGNTFREVVTFTVEWPKPNLGPPQRFAVDGLESGPAFTAQEANCSHHFQRRDLTSLFGQWGFEQ